MRYGHKSLPIYDAKVEDSAAGIVSAYCSVFNNKDYAGEIIRPGAFEKTITAANTQGKKLPTILWSHNPMMMPLGKTLEAREVLPYDASLPTPIHTLGGLRVVGQFNLDTQMGKDAFSHIAFGSLDKYSIGYFVVKDSYDRENQVIELLELDWLEWSPVNFAANDMTLTESAKSAQLGGGLTDEHLYIVREPIDFVDGSFKREIRELEGKTYAVVSGTLRASGNTEVANIRLDADAWSADDALSFCKTNGRGRFERSTKSDVEGTERLADNGARVVAQVSAFLDRVEAVKDARIREGKAGRVLSEANRTLLAGLLPKLGDVSGVIQKLLDDTSTDTSTVDGKDAPSDRIAEIKRLQTRALSVSADLAETA